MSRQPGATLRSVIAGNIKYFVSVQTDGSWWAALDNDNNRRVLSAPSSSKPTNLVKASIGPSHDPDGEINAWAVSLDRSATVTRL